MVTFDKEIRGSFIHYTIYEKGNSEPIGFLRVKKEQESLYDRTIVHFSKSITDTEKGEALRITSG